MKYLNALTVLFIVLKLAEVIAWSWWIVFLPSIIWVAPAIILLVPALILDWRVRTLKRNLKNLK